MNFFTRLLNLGRVAERESTVGMISSFGGVIDLGEAAATVVSDPMCISAVCRCVNLISGSIASMPVLEQYRDSSRVFLDNYDSVLGSLLAIQPNSRTSAFEFWRTAVRRMLLDGGVFVVPRYSSDGSVVSLEQVAANKVSYDRTRCVYTVTDPEQGFTGERIPEARIIFLRGMTTDGFKGVSVAQYAAEAIKSAAAGDSESRKRIENGGLPQLLLTEESGLLGTGTKVEGARKDFMNNTEKAIRSLKRVIAVARGYKAQPIGYSSADMQLQPAREFAVREICRFFGVPPIFVFSDSSSNYKSAEMAGVDFLVNTLDPYLCNIENELRRKLIPQEEWQRRRFKFDRSTRTAADSDSRAKYLSQLMGMSVTPNEIRSMLNLGPIPGGDTPMVSANLRSITDIINKPDNASTNS